MKHLTNYNDFFINEGKVPSVERIQLLKDDKYVILAPLTFKASCKYGAFTNWCSAAIGNEYAWNDDINRGDNILIYVIQRNFKRSEEADYKSEMYYRLLRGIDNGEIDGSDEEVVDKLIEFREDEDSLDFSKIAIEYNKKNKEYNIWTANNINLDGYDVDDLPIDEYAIQIIKDFCEK